MKINTTIGSVNIQLDTSRLEKNIAEAQKKLNERVVSDCKPFVPFSQGGLQGSVLYPEGIYGGEIEWNTPYAHFIYTGFVRTDEAGRVFVGKDEKKPILTSTPLHYGTPGTTSQWFEEAKKIHGDEWVRLVKETAGKD